MPRPKSYSHPVSQSSIESIDDDSDDGLTQADPWAAAAAAVARPRDGGSSSTRRGRPLRSATQESIESIDSIDTPLDALAAIADAVPPAAFAVGDDVEADRRGRGFRPGAVAAAHADRTYCVAYDDGDLEDRVPADRVRRRAATPPAPSPAPMPTPSPPPDTAGDEALARRLARGAPPPRSASSSSASSAAS